MAGQSAGCQTEASVFQNREISGGEAVRCAAQYLAAHQIEDADNDAWLLFSYVTHITRAMFLAERWARMDQEALERYEALLVRRAAHIPLQHLTGEQEFMGFPFRVNEHVLVPRQDTEILVEEALKVLAPGDHVLDLCTGSGVIPILLKAKTKGCRFVGLEIQKRSADTAGRSVALNHLEDCVQIVQGDVKEAVDTFGAASFSVVTCNPPDMTGGHGLTNGQEAKTIARHEVLCTLEDIVSQTAALLKPQGRMYMVHRPFRLAEIMGVLMKYGLEPKRMQRVYPFVDREPNMVLIEALKGGKPRITVEKPLIVYDTPGQYSQQIHEIYGTDWQPGSGPKVTVTTATAEEKR